jgi:putative molybdopterin biosynthesis protein
MVWLQIPGLMYSLYSKKLPIEAIMAIYLHDIPLDQAQAYFRKALEEAGLWKALGSEMIPLNEKALGRILAEPVWARQSAPHYNAVGMDGFAVRSSETIGALPSKPIVIKGGSQAFYVDTGDPLPDWADAVIPIEEVELLSGEGKVQAENRHPAAIRIRSAVTPWKNVRPMGEDIVETQLVLAAGRTLQPADLGALAACGEDQVKVIRRPRVSIFPTGTELIPIGHPAKPGEIIEFNSVVLCSQLLSWGADAVRMPISSDDLGLITSRVKAEVESSDLILLNAGSSAGSEDLSSTVVDNLGTLLVHGVAVRPGHPVILGMLDRSDGGKTPIIGVPGYPVSAALTNEIFVKPLIDLWLGKRNEEPEVVTARLTRKVTSPAGDDEYLRVVVGKVGGNVLAAPLSKSSGMITTLVNADGISIISRGVQGLESGTQISVRMYRSKKEIENTLFAIGSHDLTLDLLAQELNQRNRRLVSSNVGSLGGLIALKRGEAHFAGSHLLEPETGEYNIQAIKDHLLGIPLRMIGWVGRIQGLMVKHGNPKRIQSLNDLVSPDVTYVNRQRGAGTRVLLDFEIGKLNISADQIKGYENEEFTHLAVAAAIQSGRADCGLGIAGAAQALGLDFIPLYSEEYDLVVPLQSFEKGLMDPVLELARDAGFKKAVTALPGYEVKNMGKVLYEQGE